MRVAVQKTYPVKAIHRGKLSQKWGDAIFHADVLAISHGVLGNQNEFTDTLFRESPCFGHEIPNGPAAKLSSKSRNRAKRAYMITAFRYFQVGHVGRCAQYSW